MQNLEDSPSLVKSSKPLAVTVAWILFLVTAVIWLCFGMLSLIRAGDGKPGSPELAWILAALMFGNAIILVWLGSGIRNQKKLFFYLAVIYLLINLILTITDEFGTIDLLYLLFVASMLVFLLITRSNYRL